MILVLGLDYARWCDEGVTTCSRMKREFGEGLRMICESLMVVGMMFCKVLMYLVYGKNG